MDSNNLPLLDGRSSLQRADLPDSTDTARVTARKKHQWLRTSGLKARSARPLIIGLTKHLRCLRRDATFLTHATRGFEDCIDRRHGGHMFGDMVDTFYISLQAA
jgi:hypothetical protein